MQIFNFFDGNFALSIKGVSFLVFSVFAIATVGYLLGRITIKGVNLGTAGVFIAALLYGCLFYGPLKGQLSGYEANALKIIENIGLILFVTSVGFIAGPKFFGNLKKNFKTFILLGLVIIISGTLVCGGCILVGRNLSDNTDGELTATATGLFSGALTSTPAFSAAKEAAKSDAEGEIQDIEEILKAGGEEALAKLSEIITINDSTDAELKEELGDDYKARVLAGCDDEFIAKLKEYSAKNYESRVTVGNGIAYIFGVIGVVLFVQLIPKFMKADMAEERKKLAGGSGDTGEDPTEVKSNKKLIEIDGFGIAVFSLAAILGVLLGSIKFGSFSLTTTGGCLLVSLVLGHFAHIGPVSVTPSAPTLKVFREFGLMIFLIGAGVAGGAKFIELFEPVFFLYGVLMTIVPMIIGFIFAKFVLKLNLLNSLGSITGGMTSTPALGTLIQVSGTEDVGSSYAATYPIALISVVLCAQFLIMFL